MLAKGSLGWVTPMSEYATPPSGVKTILNPTMFWKVTAYAVSAVALLGIVLNSMDNADALGADFLAFDWTHNILHVVLAAAAFLFGYGSLAPNVAKTFALIFGVVYLALGVVGFITDVGPIGLELGENLVHILIGAWGLIAGILR
jgi:hypothetical protein